jgi:hypothetical protein
VNAHLCFAAAALLAAGLTCGCGESNPQPSSIQDPITGSVKGSAEGLVDDWSTHHVKFSNPGTEADAIRNGKHEQWLRIMNDPRYQMQQTRRSAAWANRFATPAPDMIGLRERHRPDPIFGRHFGSSLHRDWAYQITTGDPGGTAIGTYPAKYGFDSSAAPSCSDYVVFGTDEAGSTSAANIVGFVDLYDGLCPSSEGESMPFEPTMEFAYDVGGGVVETSPVLSEDGTKVAFVESVSGGSNFHVLTARPTGFYNGNLTNGPAPPCYVYSTVNGVTTETINCNYNGAVDTKITMNGNVMVSISSPFVDYADDVAYVGDDSGNLHKFTGVFLGTPAEITTGGWPFAVDGGYRLTGPVYDSVSEHIFVGSSAGVVYCIDVSSGTPSYCATSSVNVSNGDYLAGPVWDAPIVDSTAETVFSEAYGDGPNGAESVLMQATTSLASVVRVDMGPGGGDLYDGDFDNTYYSSSAGAYSGYMYFCGTGLIPVNEYFEASIPVLYRVGFNSSGTINAANDGNSYALGSAVFEQPGECTPLTEFYNASTSTDYLFLGVMRYANPVNCADQACIMSFVLGSSFPSGPAATYSLGGSNDGYGSSGIIVDNDSTQTGASQIYFSNDETGNATQASQNGLN